MEGGQEKNREENRKWDTNEHQMEIWGVWIVQIYAYPRKNQIFYYTPGFAASMPGDRQITLLALREVCEYDVNPFWGGGWSEWPGVNSPKIIE